MTALGVVRNRRGTLKNATLTQLLAEVDDVLNLGLVVSTGTFKQKNSNAFNISGIPKTEVLYNSVSFLSNYKIVTKFDVLVQKKKNRYSFVFIQNCLDFPEDHYSMNSQLKKAWQIYVT